MRLFLRIQRGIVLMLLFCYPASYRSSFAPEIYHISKRLTEEAASEGWLSLLGVSLRECWGLTLGLLHERVIVWFGGLLPIQRAVLRAILAYVLVLGLIAMALQYSSNARQQIIPGLIIGDYYDTVRPVFVSGKRLQCQPSDKASYTERCTITLAEQELIVYASRAPQISFVEPGGTCEAWYRQERRPCKMGIRHMSYWHVMLPDTLGLNSDQLHILRRHYPIENIEENTIFTTTVYVIPVLTTILLCVLLGIYRWSPKGRLTLPGVAKLVLFGFVIWFGTLISFLFLSGDFWD